MYVKNKADWKALSQGLSTSSTSCVGTTVALIQTESGYGILCLQLSQTMMVPSTQLVKQNCDHLLFYKVPMKKLMLFLIIGLMAFFPVSGFALEFLWIDDYGSRVFDCGGLHAGGRAYVKDRGQGVYRVKAVLINREVRATSIFHAAKIACGEAQEYAPVEQKPAQQTPGKKE